MQNVLTSQRYKKWRIAFLSTCLLLVVGYWFVTTSTVTADTWLRNKVEWPRTDFSKTTVDANEILSGGPPKDGIPAIDKPQFVTPQEANGWLDEKEPVIAVVINGQARSYPLQILIWHEIVNDEVGGIPISVTFCPLCNASIVFDRRVNGNVLDFGTTGKLRKSDMVMYDRQTESWWQQFTGKGIVGDYAGAELQQIPAGIIAFEDFKSAYPNGDVLSRKTGSSRPYGRNPYRGYDRIGDMPFLFDDPVDKRLPPMERVISVRNGERQRIYPFSLFKGQPVINDEFGQPLVIFSKQGTLSVLDESDITNSRLIPSVTAFSRQLNGQTLNFQLVDGVLTDAETGSQWDLLGRAVRGPLRGQQLSPVDSGVYFAFAWLAFNPDTEIYGLDLIASP